MNVARVILELRKELARLDEAILVMEKLAVDFTGKRGRPRGLRLVRRGAGRAQMGSAPGPAQVAIQVRKECG